MQERIIQFLKTSDGYISGEEISQRLNISRAAIWKHMHQLRAQGYAIEAVPHLGYQLVASPDRLHAFEIRLGLNTKIMGKNIIVKDAVTSTMDEAFQCGLEGCDEGTLVCAETQSKGRGRMGRAWVSPKHKGLYFSLVLRPALPLSRLSLLTLMAGVALREAIETVSDLKPAIKWPNDVLWQGKKLAGILTELRAESDQVKFVVIGIGININTPAHQLIDGAVSLKTAAGMFFNRVQVLQAVLRCLEKWYSKLLNGEFMDTIEAWKESSCSLHKPLRLVDPAGITQGQAIDLDEDGALLIRQDNGVVVKKTSGDIYLLK